MSLLMLSVTPAQRNGTLIISSVMNLRCVVVALRKASKFFDIDRCDLSVTVGALWLLQPTGPSGINALWFHRLRLKGWAALAGFARTHALAGPSGHGTSRRPPSGEAAKAQAEATCRCSG